MGIGYYSWKKQFCFSWESLYTILYFFLLILSFSSIERSLSLVLIWFQGGWEHWQSCFMARKHTFLGCLSSVSKQNTQSPLSHKVQLASWDTNIIITVPLTAAKAHLKIITAFYLNWVVISLEYIFSVKLLLCQREDKCRKKRESIWQKNTESEKLLMLDCKVS